MSSRYENLLFQYCFRAETVLHACTLLHLGHEPGPPVPQEGGKEGLEGGGKGHRRRDQRKQHEFLGDSDQLAWPVQRRRSRSSGRRAAAGQGAGQDAS